MKKRKIIAAVTGISATVAGLSSCDFDALFNQNAGVYGPPPPDYSQTNDYNPEDNENVDVYGPPPVTTIKLPSFSATNNFLPTVYGPPSISSELASVQDAVYDLIDSEDFKSKNSDEKKSAVLTLLDEIAENGTEEYPSALVDKETVSLDGNILSFDLVSGESTVMEIEGL